MLHTSPPKYRQNYNKSCTYRLPLHSLAARHCSKCAHLGKLMQDDYNNRRSQRMLLYNPNLFVISGGPGSGKTTLLNTLKARGYTIAPEVARQIIQEQVQLAGTALPWQDREAYTRLMLQGSIASFLQHTASPTAVFFDRGIPDTLGYARLIELQDDSSIQQACDQFRYASPVFLCPPWEEIYETDSERKQDFAEAVNTYRLLKMTYERCGYQVLEITRETPAERAAFVIQRAQERA